MEFRDDEEESETGFEFGGAVGFFDAPQSSPRQRRARSVTESGAMGFFDVLDAMSEKALGFRQAAFVYNGASSERALDRDELIAALNNNASSLGKLILRKSNLTSMDLQLLSGSMLRLHHLHVLDFSGNKLGVSGLVTLLDCCRGSVGLSELYLASIGLNDGMAEDYECVCRTLDDFPSLQLLDLSSNGLGPEVTRAIGLSGSEHPCLHTLRLERNNVSVTTAVGILQYLSGNTTLHTVIFGEESKSNSRGITMKSLLKRTFRHEKDALADALSTNIAIKSLQVDGMSTQDLSKVRTLLLQNQNLWSLREGGKLLRADLSQRGLTAVHSIIFSLTHIVELDLSGNALDAVPESVVALKSLQWLSLENNKIPSTALPFHLSNLRKLRVLLVAGNPFVIDLPKNVAANVCGPLLQWFREMSKMVDMESQVAVLCTSLDDGGESGNIAKDLEKRSRMPRRGIHDSRLAVRLRIVGTSASTSIVGKFGGALLSPRKARRASITISKAENKRSSQRLSASQKLAISPEQNRKSNIGSEKEVDPVCGTIWGVVRECTSFQLPVYAPFHRIIVVSMSLSISDWESRVRDLLSSVGGSAGGGDGGSVGSNPLVPYVILAFASVGLIAQEVRSGLVQSVSRRLRRYGVRDVVVISNDNDFQLLCDVTSAAILSFADKFGNVISRSYPALFASLRVEPTCAPLHPLTLFGSPSQVNALQWAQIAGLASQTVGEGSVCLSLEWASSCLDCIADSDVSIFQTDDLKVLFPPESFSFESRRCALTFLESCKVIIRIGWQRDQWIVNRRLASAFPALSQIRAIPPAPIGAVLCIRLFRIVSPLEMSVPSIVRKLFLQTVGVLTDISSVATDGFNGSLEVKDVTYLVQVAIERTSALTIVVSTHTDVNGQVVHMVTTAIERALEEDQVDFLRLFQAADGSEIDLDRVVSELVNSVSRQALDMTLSSSIGRHLPLLPDVLVLEGGRVFWDELHVERTIGRGSFGEIFVATFRGEKKVAVKKITRQESRGSAFSVQRETLREMWVLSLLRHPNIVSLVGACFSPLAICMEYLELGNLRAFLDSREVLPWHIRCSLLLDMASGMEYAHSLRPPLVHSDLKSPNVLLSLQGGVLVAKIADLGLASFTSMNAVTMVDNPLWAAPEMIKHTMCSPAVDVYSFGIITWELCSGLVPFASELQQMGGFLAKLSEEIVNGRRPLLTQVDNSVPKAALQLMKECWMEDARLRPTFRSIVGLLLRLSSSMRDDAKPQGIRPYLMTPIAAEPKSVTILGDVVIVLSADGHLSVYESLTLKFLQVLRWKLSERIRTSSAVSLGTEAYFVFGGDSMFILSETMAARQVQGDLSFLDILCGVGDCLWVAGRHEGGSALQVWQGNAWKGGAWGVDCRGQIVALCQVKQEMWCVHHDKEGSVIMAVPLMGRKVQRKSRVFRERILSLCSVQWDLDHVWLFTQANGVLVINCETFSMVRSLSSDCIRAACCLPDCNLLFGFCNGAGHLLGVDGSVVFSSSTTGKAFEVVDHCVSVYVPAWAVIIVCSRAGLQSWRVETIGPCPQKALLPRSVPVSKNVVVPEVKEPDSPVADMVVARRKPLPKLPLSSLPDENVSIATVGSHSQENRATTSLYMSRKAMLRATLTCDEHGRIISANAAVEDIFGHDPAELIDTSCRRLFFLPRVKQRAGSILLYSARSPQRFSETDLWRSLMHDLLHVRVVNGQHKNGAHLPLLISSSELVIAGLRFYALLFEQMPKSAAILVVDGSGLVTSASDNLQAVIGWNSQHASGKTVNTLIVSPLPSTYLVKRSFDPNSIINASAKTAGGQFIAVALQVLDFGNDVYTLMVKPAERQSMSFVAEEKVEQLSHYTLGSVLGVGMCGEVREGVHKLTGTKVAVKRLKRIQCEQAGVAFSDLEVQLMKDMVHPNVIELYDCIKMEDEICLVMELVAGQELFAYCIDHAPLEEDVARKFFCDILDGVDYIHSKGIVHRDLKLENCMLINEERVKIIDFGLGNFFLRGPLHTSCGSSNYAAPELFLSKQYFGPPVDVWAMGVILFSMTTGQFPFDEVQSTIDGYYEWPESAAVSKSLQSLIREMFELNPDLRLTLQQIRRHEWVTHGNHRSVARVVDEAIRTDVVSQMETEFGMPLELVVKSVKDCATNHFTATYRILTHATASSRVQGCSVRETDEQIQAALKKIEKDGLSLDSIKRRRKSIHVGSGGIPITRASSIQSLTPRASVPSASSGARLRKNHSGLLGCNFPSVKGSEVGAAVMGGAVQQVWISKKPQVIEQAAKFTKHIKSPAHAKQVIFSSDKAAFIAIPQGQTSAFDRNRIRTPNDFEVEARIGQGGFGTIFLCKETESGLICAIKKMSKQAVLGANQVTTVNAEKEILQKSRMARSPWIVPLFYAFSDKYHLYLAMEFCGGGDLRNLMEHVSLDEDQARFLAAEIVACVHHFHERGCIHRDLKPSNFLISSSGHLRLVDFGLSKSSQHQVQESGSGGLRIFLDSGEYKTITVESKTNAWDCVNMLKWKLRLGASDPYVLRLCNTNDAERSLKIAWTILRGEDCPLLLVKARPNHRLEFVFDETGQGCKMPMTSPDGRIEARLLLTSVVGTPQYMAREMLQGVGYDATVDWWSVGCILYEMVAGVLPFSGSSAESVFNDVLSERKVDFPPTVSADARDLIGRLLAEPSARLGKNGIDEITRHKFFKGIDWGRLHTAQPVFVPNLESIVDCSYFEGANIGGAKLDSIDNATPLSNDPWVSGWNWSSNP